MFLGELGGIKKNSHMSILYIREGKKTSQIFIE